MSVKLVRIEQNELKNALWMHRRGFWQTFKKYHDKINPIFRTYRKYKTYYYNPSLNMFWIVYNGEKVGQIWIGIKEDKASLARLFVLPQFQNKGIAQQAIKIAEALFPNHKHWQLDTIKQEKNNCHLYEKMGYKKTGEEKIINNKMTLIYYEKEIENNE